jgi:hypothetical protein
MLGRSSLFWAVLAVALAGTLVYAPAYVAERATDGGPVSFMSRPQEGWRFLAAVVPAIGDARAASAERAAAIAVRAFAGTSVRPTRVGLLFLPERRLAVGSGKERHTVTAKRTLVWKVAGRTRPGGRVRTVALIDFESGRLVYDVRDAR